jgi:hypothetical protein
MRLEDHDAGQPAIRPGEIAHGRQKRLVTAMHTVEIADRKDGAAGVGRYVIESVNDVHEKTRRMDDALIHPAGAGYGQG